MFFFLLIAVHSACMSPKTLFPTQAAAILPEARLKVTEGKVCVLLGFVGGTDSGRGEEKMGGSCCLHLHSFTPNIYSSGIYLQ